MTVPEICVQKLQCKIAINLDELEGFARKAVHSCLSIHGQKTTELTKLPEVFVWLISDHRMSQLHRQFLGEAGPTDVLTFQHGEIFISVETAKRHARVFRNSLVRELQLYIVHGLLHLHGLDDQTASGARRMKKAQEKILRDCGAR